MIVGVQVDPKFSCECGRRLYQYFLDSEAKQRSSPMNGALVTARAFLRLCPACDALQIKVNVECPPMRKM